MQIDNILLKSFLLCEKYNNHNHKRPLIVLYLKAALFVWVCSYISIFNKNWNKSTLLLFIKELCTRVWLILYVKLVVHC